MWKKPSYFLFILVLFPAKSVDQNAASQISIQSMHSAEINFSFIYIAHPRAVTHLSWRETSKYMPKYVNIALTDFFFI